ncbi:MAG: efflux RND transporter permease subunit [Rhodospirillaceae bacterium]
MSELFIRRPVATFMLSLGVFLAGVVAFVFLPVAPLPAIDFPTLQVQARLPGANPTTMAATVAAPLERRLGTIAGVAEMTSTSSEGSTNIAVQFDLDRDVVGAARDVQAALNASGGDLPADMPMPPVWRKANPADSPILIMAVSSEVLSSAKLYDATDTIIAQRISQIEGVSQVIVSGAEKPAVRVRVNPAALAAMGLGLEDVRASLAKANVDMPKGGFDGPETQATIGANDQLFTASDYRPLVLRAKNGAVVRLTAVASVSDGVENTRMAAWFNGDRAILVIIMKQAGANVIETVDRIKAVLPQLQEWMPAGSTLSVVSDRTESIRANVGDVEKTLMITVVLVVLVVLVSLGRFTPTLAASITIPLSLSATSAVMWLLGYSLDNISLMALTISVGFVVDDAIVMIENITRHIERGEEPLTAAILGAREITFTVVSITVSLVAVFIPLLFMGGIVGRLFHEFAVTLTVAIMVSGVVSITVTPTLYGHMMSSGRRRWTPVGLARVGEAAFGWSLGLYLRGLGWVMRHQRIMLGVALGTVGMTVYLYGIVPKGLFPPQDIGLIIGVTEARSDVSFKALAERQQKAIRIVMSDPAVATVGSFIGAGGPIATPNQGRMFISLKPAQERSVSPDEVVARLRPKLARVEGLSVFLQAAQDVRVGGRLSKGQFQFVLWDESLEELREWAPRYIERLKSVPGLADVSSDQDAAARQMLVTVDRDAASRLGIDMTAVDSVLEDAFAQRQVSTIYTQRNQYHVVLEIDPREQEDPSSLSRLFVATTDGRQVPLAAIARFEPGTAPVSVSHQGQFPATTVSFNLTPGLSLGHASGLVRAAATEIGLPPGIHTEFAGNAKAFAESLRDEPILIGAALLAIYIVLGILYENTLHPLTILSTLPSAGIGALLALLVSGHDLSIISIIGVILLMGIVKKNGIMLVDFAIVAERSRGISPEVAILEACHQRFRPITMTTLATVLGAIPLAIGTGPGGEMRRPLGVALVGGLIVSQFLTLYTTPVVYLALARLSRWRQRRRERRLFQEVRGE